MAVPGPAAGSFGIWEVSPVVPRVHKKDGNGTKLLSTGFPGEDPSASDSLLPGSERSSVELLSNDMVSMSIPAVLSNAMSNKQREQDGDSVQ